MSEQTQTAGLSTAESDCSSMNGSRHGATKLNNTNDGNNNNKYAAPAVTVETKYSAPATKSPSPIKKMFFVASSDKRRSSSAGSISNSAPTILIRTPEDALSQSTSSAPGNMRAPLKSAMVTRTIHESLHRGRRSSDGNVPPNHNYPRSVSFAQVKIREYERVMGDNPSVRSGPPLSIGWRYVDEPTSISIDDYEEGKGECRASSEFLVPKAVREKILKEQADVSRREMVATVRMIQKEKAQRRKTVVNLPMQKTEERVEGAKRKMKKILKPSTSYEHLEAKLWDDAHAIAIEKAHRLEESIRKGESVSSRDLYNVGTPCGNIVPCRRNSVQPITQPPLPHQSQQRSQSMETGNENNASRQQQTATVASLGDHDITSETVPNIYAPQSANSNQKLRSAEGMGEQLEQHQPPQATTPPRNSDSEKIISPSPRSSNIVATEDSEDEDDMLSKLLLEDAVISDNM